MKTEKNLVLDRLQWSKIPLFVYAFLLVMICIAKQDLVAGGGDATDVWRAIVGLAEGSPQASYVMYKGMFSCYPYVWFYQLSKIFGVSDFFFIKLFHAGLFAYISAEGFPVLFEELTHKSVCWIRRAVLITLLFFAWRGIFIFELLNIDLPSLACFLASAVLAVQWKNKGKSFQQMRILLLWILIGCGLCFSGQYSIATFLLICHILRTIIRIKKDNPAYLKERKVILLLAIPVVFALKFLDWVFMTRIVEPLVVAGGFIPSKEAWLLYGLTNSVAVYSLFIPSIMSPLGLPISDEMLSLSAVGLGEFSASAFLQIASIWVKYPLEMIQIWCNRLFLGLSLGAKTNNILYLTISYSALFYFGLFLKQRFKSYRDFMDANVLIYLAFLFSVLVPCALHMELRYAIAVQGLILSVAILNCWSENGAFSKLLHLKADSKVNYSVIIGIMFVLICIIHYGTLNELRFNQEMDPIETFQYIFEI